MRFTPPPIRQRRQQCGNKSTKYGDSATSCFSFPLCCDGAGPTHLARTYVADHPPPPCDDAFRFGRVHRVPRRAAVVQCTRHMLGLHHQYVVSPWAQRRDVQRRRQLQYRRLRLRVSSLSPCPASADDYTVEVCIYPVAHTEKTHTT